MTRAEFAEMVRRLVGDGTITLLQASQLKHAIDIGEVAQAATSLPWRDLPGRLSKEEFKNALRSAAVFLTPKGGGTALLSSAEQAVIRKETPPEVKRILRERLRNHFRGDYEATMNGLAKKVSSGGNVRQWHEAMSRENRAYIARMMTAGTGRALAEGEINEVNRLALDQGRFLKGFADSVSARKILGIDYSEKYIAARSRSYGGVGWATWFKGNEIVEGVGDGKVIKYIAVDDPRTCSPCHDAEVAGPYLPGAKGLPYPGEVCRGHGHCRCRHEIVFDMEAWRELKGLPPLKPPKEPKTEKEKEAQLKRIEAKRTEKARKQAIKEEQIRIARREQALKEKMAFEEEAAKSAERVRLRRLRDRALDEGIDPNIPAEEVEARLKALEVPIRRLPTFERLDEWMKDSEAGNFLLDPERIKAAYDALKAGKDTTDTEEIRGFLYNEFFDRKLPEKSIKVHGMTDAEEMVGFDFDGVEVRWTDRSRVEQNVNTTLSIMYLEDLRGNGMPSRLWETNQGMFFTEQVNNMDAYWAKAYNTPGFVSAATGGDGHVVIYGGNGLSYKSLAHELGHNLAKEVYGNTTPADLNIKVNGVWKPIKTEYQLLVESKDENGDPVELPVSDYAKNSLGEDFAEAVGHWVANRTRIKNFYKHRAKFVEKILRNEGEEHVRAALRGDLKSIPEVFDIDLINQRAGIPSPSGRSAPSPDAPTVAPARVETEAEKKERRRQEHLRWKERKAREKPDKRTLRGATPARA